jgi:hypothetical protein
MTRFRRDAIGLVFPARRHEVTAEDAVGAPLALALIYSFAGTRELSDPRLCDGPLKLWEHIVGGEIELRAGGDDPKGGDVITSVGRVADVIDRSTGQELVIDTASQNQHGDMMCEARFTFRVPFDGGIDHRPKRRTDPPPSTMRSTQIGRFDFVEVRETRTDGSGSHEIDALRTAIDVVALQAQASGVTPGLARLKRVFARVLAASERGSEIVVHGKRDPRRSGIILFEAMGRAGLKLLDAGIAEIAQ